MQRLEDEIVRRAGEATERVGLLAIERGTVAVRTAVPALAVLGEVQRLNNAFANGRAYLQTNRMAIGVYGKRIVGDVMNVPHTFSSAAMQAKEEQIRRLTANVDAIGGPGMRLLRNSKKHMWEMQKRRFPPSTSRSRTRIRTTACSSGTRPLRHRTLGCTSRKPYAA